MTWARISNPLTVQFAKILPENRRRDDLKKGKNWLNLKTYQEYLAVLRTKTRLLAVLIARRRSKTKKNYMRLNLSLTQCRIKYNFTRGTQF